MIYFKRPTTNFTILTYHSYICKQRKIELLFYLTENYIFWIS